MGVTDSVISLSPGTTCNADGICELTQDVSDSPFYSRDVAPVPIAAPSGPPRTSPRCG